MLFGTKKSTFKKTLELKFLSFIIPVLLVASISAGAVTILLQRSTLRSLTEFGTEKTANIILQDIETTMLEGKSDITKKIVANMRKIRGIEEITVLNSEGREAFSETSPTHESRALRELKSGKDRLLSNEGSRVTLYLPLKNVSSCRICHQTAQSILGAVKVSVSIEKESRKAMGITALMVVIILVAAFCFSILLLLMLRKIVIRPVQSIERAAALVAGGDLSFNVDTRDDEIGRVGAVLKESFLGLEAVLHRIKELSDRIVDVVAQVEKEGEKILKGAETEAQEVSSISSSVEELNATTAEIAENTGDLAVSAGDASASIEQMVSSIRQIDRSMGELEEAVESTSASIAQLSASIKEVAASSEDLSGASEETVGAISEIAATIKEVETHAKESARLSENVTSDAATLGIAAIKKTLDGMKEIASAVQDTAQYINILGNRSKEIEKMLNVIQAVNEETTLLSLNAAILAAKAKEHGKGFAVVASEMKDLSERTGKSTEEISSLIKAVQHEIENAGNAMRKGIASVEGGLKLAEEAESALKSVLNTSQKSSEMTLSIKKSTGEQAKAAGQVMQAMELVRKMIENIVRATAEQAKGAAVITQAAEQMKYLSHSVGKATGEQATTSSQIAQTTELVSERTRDISKSLSEHKEGSGIILRSIEAVKDIPLENRSLAFRINATLWNLQKDAELLKAEIERFKLSSKRGYSLRLGVVPLQEPSAMFRKFTPLSEYLSGRLGKKVDLKVAIDMESAVRDLGENITQLCAMGPANYIEAQTKYGVKVIAKALRQGKPFHRAAVVVGPKSAVRSLNDLKGKTFAFVSPKSATGHIMPMAVLKDAGIDLDDLKGYEFLGDHEKVSRAVISGTFDAGGLMEETAQKYREQGLRILQLSVEIPEFNICANASLDTEAIKSIQEALVSLDPSKKEEAEILKSLGKDCTGFVPATDRDYIVFREKITEIEAEITAESHLQMRIARSGD